ncbi:MAG TPA: BglII/BstYI family type II restriction endonuclease [Terriglobia bacterium]|nr:BglII/BstYI family type II restriction endonuclease [Terriglobia bacterium]
MRIVEFHSHLNGYEWLLVHHKHVWKELLSIVASIDAEKFKTKVSKEKTMTGKLLYSPSELNAQFAKGFHKSGWKESRTSYWVTDDYNLIRKTLHLEPPEQKREIEAAGRRPIYSYNQTDYVKDRVAIEVQLGKYSFISYDLFVKHLAFYVGDQIDLGIEVLPMKTMQECMSSGPGYYEGALYDVARQGRGVPAVPLILIGIAP